MYIDLIVNIIINGFHLLGSISPDDSLLCRRYIALMTFRFAVITEYFDLIIL